MNALKYLESIIPLLLKYLNTYPTASAHHLLIIFTTIINHEAAILHLNWDNVTAGGHNLIIHTFNYFTIYYGPVNLKARPANTFGNSHYHFNERGRTNRKGRWVLNGYFFRTSPLLLGYKTRDWCEMVSKSKSRPSSLSS